MGKNVKLQFDDCLEKGKISPFPKADELVAKEMRVAESDLSAAASGLKHSQWKWSTIQAYYAMFHTARALLYRKNYRERSHYCLRVAIEVLYVNEGLLPERFVDAFQAAKVMRENADYEENFSESGASKLFKEATDFLAAAKKIFQAAPQGAVTS